MAKVIAGRCGLLVTLHFEVTARFWEALPKVSKFLKILYDLAVFFDNFGVAQCFGVHWGAFFRLSLSFSLSPMSLLVESIHFRFSSLGQYPFPDKPRQYESWTEVKRCRYWAVSELYSTQFLPKVTVEIVLIF